MSNWSSYSPSSLSTWISTHLPHYTGSFQKISPDEITPSYVITDHTDSYVTCLVILGVLLFSWFLIYGIIELIVRFICCCCCSRKHAPPSEFQGEGEPHHPIQHKRVRRRYIVTALCAILCCAGFGASYHQHTETTNGMKTVTSSLDSISTFQHSFVRHLNHVELLLSDASSMMGIMLNPTNPKDTLPDQIYQTLYLSQGAVNSTQSDLATVHQQATSVTLNHTLKIIHDEEQYRDASVVTLLTVLLVLLFVLMIIYWYFTSLSFRSRSCVQLLVLFTLGIALLYACILVSLSFGASDICQQPDAYADYAIDTYTSDDESRLIVRYYLHCTSGDVNPIQQPIVNASTVVRELIFGVHLLNTTLWNNYTTIAQDDTPYINQLYYDAIRINQILNQTMNFISCGEIHDDYLTARDATCIRILNGSFIGGIVIGVTIILFLIFRLCIRARPPPSPHSDDAAYVPLNPSPSPLPSTPPPPYSPPQSQPATFYTYATPQNTGYITDPLHINAWGQDDNNSHEGQPSNTSSESYYFYPTERR